MLKCLATTVSLPEVIEMTLESINDMGFSLPDIISNLEQVMRYMRFELGQEMLILLG